MSWFTHNMQIRRRLAMKAEGRDPYKVRRDPNAMIGEFNSLSSSIAGERAGFGDGKEIDLNARAMGVNTSIMKADPNMPANRLIDTAHMRPSPDPLPVRKAQHAVELPRYGTSLDGTVALERIVKAEAIAEGRSDADATAHEHGKPPAPATSATPDLDTVILTALRRAGLSEQQIADFIARQVKPTWNVFKSNDPVQAAIQANFAELQKSARHRVSIIKRDDGRELPVVVRKSSSGAAPSGWASAMQRLFPQTAA